MPFYLDDLKPLIMRAVEALDRGEDLTFEELRRRVYNGELRELINEAGNYPEPVIPDVDWQEITDQLIDSLEISKHDEAEHFYVSQDGYCLLISLLIHLEQDAEGLFRPR
tara:strand:+ start:438 stop:767 length:330 start_codon:yes stop_codon:yes gene_type:complete